MPKGWDEGVVGDVIEKLIVLKIYTENKFGTYAEFHQNERSTVPSKNRNKTNDHYASLCNLIPAVYQVVFQCHFPL